MSSEGTRAPAQAVLAAALLFFSGCKTANTYVLQVDAISQTGAVAQKAGDAKSFKVRSPNPQIAEDSLRYREVSEYVKTALSGKGLYEAPSLEAADLIIEIDYGVETPRMKYETVNTPIIVYREGMGTKETVSAGRNSNGTEQFRTIRTPGPQIRKVVGYREETEAVIVYEKYLKVSARENQEATEGRRPPEVWSVNISAEDESNELRRYLPILASATADYIDTNTKREKSVAVHEDDAAVKFIRKGMSPFAPGT